MNAHPALIDLVRERQGPRHPDYTALRRACDDVRRMADVLAQGVDPDSADPEGATLLHVSDLPLGVVQLLLAAGADADAPWYTGHGRTPLFFATKQGVPTALFQSGADLESRDNDGLTPLLFNIQHGAVAVVRELLTLGSDITAQDTAGLDVFDYASLYPDARIRERMNTVLRSHHQAWLKRAGLMAIVTPRNDTEVPPRRL